MKKKLLYQNFFTKSWTWEQVRTSLQKQMDSGIVFTADDWETLFACYPQSTELSVPWSDFTTKEWVKLLISHPQLADQCSAAEPFVPWNSFTPDDWESLIGYHPKFANRCPCFDQFLPKQWTLVLAAHPELEGRGVCFNKFTEENWKDICNRNSDFFTHRENWTLRDELRPAFFLRDYLIKRKSLLIDLQTAANVCDEKMERYQIRGSDTDSGRPRTEDIKKEDVVRILAPFRHEQEEVYNFLSSGKTNGILSKVVEEFAQELPMHNRNDLENLIAIVRPGPLMYWKEYKENRPCRLAVASEITKRTRGVLLYGEQQKQAIQLLTGCSPEEAVMLWANNISERLNRPYRELLLQLIADYNGITREKAEELCDAWRSYGPYPIRYDRIRKTAHRIYLRALDYLRKNGTKGVKCRKSSDEEQQLPGFQGLES